MISCEQLDILSEEPVEQDTHSQKIHPTLSPKPADSEPAVTSREEANIPAQEPVAKDRLSGLPDEILLEVFSWLCPKGDGFRLLRMSKRFYHSLILELYKESGKQLNWLPLYWAARDGNMKTLERCLEARPPLDMRWRNTGPYTMIYFPAWGRPLDVALRHVQVDVVRRLLEEGADPRQVQGKERWGVIDKSDPWWNTRLHPPGGEPVLLKPDPDKISEIRELMNDAYMKKLKDCPLEEEGI